jgi:hypothetical protein
MEGVFLGMSSPFYGNNQGLDDWICRKFGKELDRDCWKRSLAEERMTAVVKLGGHQYD